MTQEKQRRRHLWRLAEQLPLRHQRLLGYYVRDDMTLRQIGRKMGFTESRACQILKECVVRLSEMADEDLLTED